MTTQTTTTHDVVLIGGGIMSATLGTLLQKLEPTWSIALYENLDQAGLESSDPWNNAGTGHAALCELNYAPRQADGTVDPTKALGINEQFWVSRQFWSSLIQDGTLKDPKSFINPLPHMSFVWGDDHADYLQARYEAMSPQPLFETMGTRRTRSRSASGPRCSSTDATTASAWRPPASPAAPTWTSAP